MNALDRLAVDLVDDEVARSASDLLGGPNLSACARRAAETFRRRVGARAAEEFRRRWHAPTLAHALRWAREWGAAP